MRTPHRRRFTTEIRGRVRRSIWRRQLLIRPPHKTRPRKGTLYCHYHNRGAFCCDIIYLTFDLTLTRYARIYTNLQILLIYKYLQIKDSFHLIRRYSQVSNSEIRIYIYSHITTHSLRWKNSKSSSQKVGRFQAQTK